MRLTVERPQGQWLTGGDGHTFWFDSGSLAVDFAYTGGLGKRPEWELWHSPADAITWFEGRFPDVDSSALGERELVDGKALRDAISRAVLAASRDEAPSPDDVDVINLFAATPDIPPTLAGGARQAGRSKARVGQALSVLAREAVELFTPAERERIRVCDGDHCEIVFYDESRSNNRRWCSMQRCGNRAKVRKHRSKEEA